MAFLKSLALLSLAGSIAASPCPYGQLAERGELSETESANFYAARSEGEAATEAQLKARRSLETRAEHKRQEEFYKRQLLSDALTLGGGLLNGVLQPFTGVLDSLDVPVPQEFSLKLIPGDDADHQYVAPTPSDVRG